MWNLSFFIIKILKHALTVTLTIMYKIFVFFQAYYYYMVSSLNDQWGWAGICLFSHNKTCKS